MKKNVHLIGNAHLDPVWLWRFQDGLSEIKATFRSALDRIRDFDDFVFTSACASYYKWVEENCPEMFEEIVAAVKAKKWAIVGGMWVQPDCNMPSAESFARHFLYSQNYFKEKFGITARTGYNVDSFGHNAALPRLLRKGGLENYIYMRPNPTNEMQYPFGTEAFRWQCGEDEVLTYRLKDPYCNRFDNDEKLRGEDARADGFDHDMMFFYGVGNHGGGPTIKNIKIIHEFAPTANNAFVMDSPDDAFAAIRGKDFSKLPVFVGELQNHASGCYSANSRMKALNRACENRLGEAERLEALAARAAGFKPDPAKNAEAWQYVLFNQFHDILCGCSLKSAYGDAYAFGGAAEARGLALTNAAAQRISWSINTDRGLPANSKDMLWNLWEQQDLGTPIVVFNPLAHAVKVPVNIMMNQCAAVTDENDRLVPWQIVRADRTNGQGDKYYVQFREEVPAYGWKTFWVYANKSFGENAPTVMQAEPTMLKNDKITVTFDESTGNIASIVTADGRQLLGKRGVRTILVNDEKSDTWSHNRFVFDEAIGEFSEPTFTVAELGAVRASVLVKQKYKNSTLEQTYTLFPGEAAVHVTTKLVLNEALVMVKLAADAGLPGGRYLREASGSVIEAPQNGREMPMQRWMLLEEGGAGIALLNDSRYSSSAADGELRMVLARSCYYADHYGARDARMELQDIGEHVVNWTLKLYEGDLAALSDAAEELNAVFPVINETYHKGSLPQTFTGCELDVPNVTVTAVKTAEDKNGVIVRLWETAGRETAVTAKIAGGEIVTSLKPHEIRCFRVADTVSECDFTEAEI